MLLLNAATHIGKILHHAALVIGSALHNVVHKHLLPARHRCLLRPLVQGLGYIIDAHALLLGIDTRLAQKILRVNALQKLALIGRNAVVSQLALLNKHVTLQAPGVIKETALHPVPLEVICSESPSSVAGSLDIIVKGYRRCSSQFVLYDIHELGFCSRREFLALHHLQIPLCDAFAR